VNSRIRLLLLAILIAFGVLFGRATWIATVRASSLSSFAQAQTKATVALPAGRGTIFDAMGTPLALGEQATTVYVDPHEITRPRAEAKAAARVLGLKPKAVLSALTTPDTHFVYIARKASPKLASALARRKLPGFHFYGEERRSYPQGALASQVLGYAGVDNKGLSGLELELDPQLTGTPGSQTVVRDPIGRPIAIQSVTPAREGQAAFLTRDHTIKRGAGLRATVAHGMRRSATAIVLDPRPGVLALATAGLQREPGRNEGTARRRRRQRRLRARLRFQGRDDRRRALRGRRHAADEVHAAVLDPGRRPRHPRRGGARHRDDDGLADPPALVQRRHGDDRAHEAR
jgi:cell division protein FtsI/penicillin-binding protein 2